MPDHNVYELTESQDQVRLERVLHCVFVKQEHMAARCRVPQREGLTSKVVVQFCYH